jgi:hypothetical protein
MVLDVLQGKGGLLAFDVVLLQLVHNLNLSMLGKETAPIVYISDRNQAIRTSCYGLFSSPSDAQSSYCSCPVARIFPVDLRDHYFVVLVSKTA